MAKSNESSVAGTRRGLRPALALCLTLLAVIGLTLALAGSAIAQNDPVQDQYCEEGVINEVTGECEGTAAVQDPVQDPGAVAPSVSSEAQGGGGGGGGDGRVVGSLPFTGVDLAVLGAVAFVLLAAGFVLRRLSAPRES